MSLEMFFQGNYNHTIMICFIALVMILTVTVWLCFTGYPNNKINDLTIDQPIVMNMWSTHNTMMYEWTPAINNAAIPLDAFTYHHFVH